MLMRMFVRAKKKDENKWQVMIVESAPIPAHRKRIAAFMPKLIFAQTQKIG
jgi:hypothetical protein